MAKRGRKSAAELELTPLVSSDTLPEPPYHLASDEAAEVWRSTLACLPSGWVAPEMHEILAAYCNHVATCRLITREIERFQFGWFKAKGGVERLNKLTSMRERESRAALAAARSLRLTNQSRMRPEAASRLRAELPVGAPRPWDFRG